MKKTYCDSCGKSIDESKAALAWHDPRTVFSCVSYMCRECYEVSR